MNQSPRSSRQAASGDALSDDALLNAERRALLEQLEDWLEMPMLALGLVWLGLLIVEFVGTLSAPLEILGTLIWGVFLLDFTLKWTLAPDKSGYLKSNWLTALSLLVPALRVFRIARVFRLLRVARAARGLRLFRLMSSLNRGMKALGGVLGRRGFGYVVALTVAVTLGGAAGIFAFENEVGGSFKNYGEALWWTAMLMTTLGSEKWPQSDAGRTLCFLLALYAFAVFGYVTATLATFFVGRDAENEDAELPNAQSIEDLKAEIRALRAEVRALIPRDTL